MYKQRLKRQIEFVCESDKLKAVERRTSPIGMQRRENSAEHSWHIAIMLWTLAEYAPKNVDINKCIKLLLLHDIVEIDAGDSLVYDDEARKNKQAAEQKAAERIFSLLPENQSEYFKKLWNEYEEAKTPEAQFANAIDRLQPILLNYNNDGGTWVEYEIKAEQVLERNAIIKEQAPELWELVLSIVENAKLKNLLL